MNHAGLAVSGDMMIATAPLTGGVNATDIDPQRVWRVGRPAAKGRTADLTDRPPGAWQCGSDPDDLAQISPVVDVPHRRRRLAHRADQPPAPNRGCGCTRC